MGALRAVGAECWQLNGLGVPDLLVRFRGRLYAAEVKTARGALTKYQGDFPIWRTVEDALRTIGAVHARTGEQLPTANDVLGILKRKD